jgi:hypothetical protein
MKGFVNYYNRRLRDEVLLLPNDVLAKLLVMVDVLVECGPDPDIPQISYIDNKLFRLKLFKTNNYVYYCQSDKNEVTVLHISEKCDTLSQQFLSWLKMRQMEVSKNDEVIT